MTMRGHDVLGEFSRRQRRMILADVERARRTGEWGPWRTAEIPVGAMRGKWSSQFTHIHKNAAFGVLDRTLANGVRHFGITSLTEVRPTFHEMQRIKNELAGKEATAVEVYPPQSELIDEANMFHLWILPFGLDYGLR